MHYATLACCVSGADSSGNSAIGTGRRSPGAQALADHGAICGKCSAAAKAGKPFTQFCGAGYLLALFALRARARRVVSR
jgi:MYXO-CTERM domain-containing protein